MKVARRPAAAMRRFVGDVHAGAAGRREGVVFPGQARRVGRWLVVDVSGAVQGEQDPRSAGLDVPWSAREVGGSGAGERSVDRDDRDMLVAVGVMQLNYHDHARYARSGCPVRCISWRIKITLLAM
jgi:hypothetical protein